MGEIDWKRQVGHEDAVRELWRRHGQEPLALAVYYGYVGGVETLHAIRTRDEIAPGDQRWHLSVSGAGRVPSWDELAATAHALRPGVPMAAGVPPRSWWINVHEHVLHLWELRDEALIAQWRSERRGDTPT